MLRGGGLHCALKAERGREDDLVAVPDQALDHLRDLWTLGDVFLERRLHLRAELLLDVQASLVVRLRPAAVVVRTDVDPRCLERRGLPRRAGRDAEREDERAGDRERQNKGEPPCLHGLLSPATGGGARRRLYDPRSRSPRSPSAPPR